MKTKLPILLTLVGILFINGCTNLNEVILDETSATGLSDKQAADGIIAPVYARLPDIFLHTNYFTMQEISTDEAILPYRGGTDWGDNGIYIAMHQHTHTSTDPNIRSTWGFILQGLSRSITAINALPTNNDPSAKTYLAEARGMRAYYNMLLFDMFGVVFVKDDLGATSVILRDSQALDYLMKELLAVEPNLETSVGPGRLTKGAVWGLLARLYLNSGVYRDRFAASFTFAPADMDKVIEYCDKIIASGQYSLSNDFFSIFGSTNHDNKELIFAVDQRADLNGHNRMAYFSISGDQFPDSGLSGRQRHRWALLSRPIITGPG